MADSFQFYKQLDSADCGATCLRMVARHYGRHYSLEYLRQLSYLDREGVSLMGISDAAEKIGFRTLGVKTGFKRLSEDIPLPCVAHWQQDHFVVVYKISAGKVFVADPKIMPAPVRIAAPPPAAGPRGAFGGVIGALADVFGGRGALAGMMLATVSGLYLGLAQPSLVGSLTGLTSDTPIESFDLIPGTDSFWTEATP